MGLTFIQKFVREVWPLVNRQLDAYIVFTEKMPDKELAKQALSSIRHKRFHCLGGSVYALYPGTDPGLTIPFIVAYQTMSDYLDNLCDRAGIGDGQAFMQLHKAMSDAVDPSRSVSDYYRYYPLTSDNGYLRHLVSECRKAVARLSAYPYVRKRMLYLAEMYSHLQTYKHLSLEHREDRIRDWTEPMLVDYPMITRWEFAAATGSTLGVFILFAIAQNSQVKESEVDAIFRAYFPWITGLHILLDYFIDLEEDRENEDLNFIAYYENEDECVNRLSLFAKQAMANASNLRNPAFHTTMVQGLLAMYLSDPKANTTKNRYVRKSLINDGGCKTWTYYMLCHLLRRKNRLYL